ncbi:hypothetical protein Pmani_031328 [Petrolisthes manimaculis]|uniref:Uncharacterized protein n=1 Tax=Petrolisthes manimaculis TaxID=1843537 RepID=A0AAE1NVZ4_9EUCA|nr:hypothetical protein Pmani_031328 [Petrolisthes manimaculis]
MNTLTILLCVVVGVTWGHLDLFPELSSNTIVEDDVQGGVGFPGQDLSTPVGAPPVINHHMDYGPRVYGSGVGYVRPDFDALREALNYIGSHQNANLFIHLGPEGDLTITDQDGNEWKEVDLTGQGEGFNL